MRTGLGENWREIGEEGGTMAVLPVFRMTSASRTCRWRTVMTVLAVVWLTVVAVIAFSGVIGS
jgi:hypothetical protein